MMTNKLAIALAVLGLAALASGHPSVLSKGFRPSGNMLELKGTALVVVKDFRDADTGRQWCEVYVEMVGTKMGEKRKGLDVDAVRVDLDEKMSEVMHSDFTAAPFVSGDNVRMVVEKDAAKPGVFLLREIKNVEASKASKIAPDGPKTILHIVVNYQDENAVCDQACVTNNMYTQAGYNVNDMYGESSYGLMSFSGDIVTVARPVNLSEDLNDGLQTLIGLYNPLATNAGFNPDNYDMVHYHTKAIGGLGVAYRPGREGFTNSVAHDTIAHEMGHNFGFQHSGQDAANDGDIEDVYNDRSCTMGYQLGANGILRNFNVLKRLQAGWLPQSQVFDLAADSCEDVTLNALVVSPVGATNPHAIRANRDGTLNYYVSYRADSDYDGNIPNGFGGVTIHHDGTQADTRGSASSGIITALGSGGVFEGLNIVVTVNSISATSADVTVCSTDDPPPPPTIDGSIACGDVIEGSTSGADNTVGNPAGDRVYSFTIGGTSDIDVVFSTCGGTTNYDSYLRIFNSDLTSELFSNDDDCGVQSTISATLSPGDYNVAVDGFSSNVGDFTLTMTCDGGAGPCDDDDEGLVALARSFGPAFDFVVGCDGLDQYCTGTYASYMQQYCPTTCGACEVDGECRFDNDSRIAILAAAAGQPSITNCDMAAAFLGPTACTGQYGSTMQTTCPCQC